MRFKTLPEWLDWQEKLHFTSVDPGLDRIGLAWQRMEGDVRLPFTVITVAGTNGKGSSVALLESILRQAGYKTGTYTSPHIVRYNERIAINNEPVDDQTICNAFDTIDQARQDVSLTYFEFSTLAAATIFIDNNIDIAILEVGMGGRLDAVNLFDTDIALITPISLDHTHWLGDTREKIGFEKAGIITANNPVVCSECPPDSVIEHAKTKSSKLYQSNIDFQFEVSKDSWNWKGKNKNYLNLPFPALEGRYQFQNAAAVLQVLALLSGDDFTINQSAIEEGLRRVELLGRYQRIAGDIELILDVTHNEQGAKNLLELLSETPVSGRTFAVIGMLSDKDAERIASILSPSIDLWYVASLDGDRGMSSSTLTEQLKSSVSDDKIQQFETVELAYNTAMIDAERGDRILIFGSFHTVEAAIKLQN